MFRDNEWRELPAPPLGSVGWATVLSDGTALLVGHDKEPVNPDAGTAMLATLPPDATSWARKALPDGIPHEDLAIAERHGAGFILVGDESTAVYTDASADPSIHPHPDAFRPSALRRSNLRAWTPLQGAWLAYTGNQEAPRLWKLDPKVGWSDLGTAPDDRRCAALLDRDDGTWLVGGVTSAGKVGSAVRAR